MRFAARAFESVFRVRPDEAGLALLMFGYLLTAVSTFIVGRTTRDALFLHRVDLEHLPLMYSVVAIAVSGASYYYGRVADRVRRDKLISISLATFSVLMSAFFILISPQLSVWSGPAPAWVYALLYVAVEVMGALSMIQFWTLATDVFSGRQAKRVFAFIGAGGVLANVICGFSVGALAPVLGAEALLLVGSGLYALCLLWVFWIRVLARAQLHDLLARSKGRPSRSSSSAPEPALATQHLRLIAAMVAMTFVSVTLVDYQFKVIARSSLLSQAELTSFFGHFYGYGGIVACFMQFFVTSRLLERTGLIPSLLVLPGMMGLGVVASFVPSISSLVAVTLAKGSENIFRYTVNDASSQLLYVPVPSSKRGRAKAVIDGMLKPLAMGLTGLGLFGASLLLEPQTLAARLSIVVLVLLGGWMALVWRMRGPYVEALVESIQTRRLDIDLEGWRSGVDKATVEVLEARLQSEETEDVLHGIEIARSLSVELPDSIVPLVDHASELVRAEALSALSGQSKAVDSMKKALRDPSAMVRAKAVTALCETLGEEAVPEAAVLLQDLNLDVKAAACTTLFRWGGSEGERRASEAWQTLAQSSQAESRMQAARVLRLAGPPPSLLRRLSYLLEDRERSVRVEAMRAARPEPEVVELLIERLVDPYEGGIAQKTLAGFGPSIESTLVDRLLASNTLSETKTKLVPVLRKIGGASTWGAFMEVMAKGDPEVRRTLCIHASRLRSARPSLEIDTQRILRILYSEAEEIFSLHARCQAIQSLLLEDALQTRIEQRMECLLSILELLHPRAELPAIRRGLASSRVAVRANSAEALESILPAEQARWVMPLVEDLPRRVRIAKGLRCLPHLRSLSEVESLGLLVQDGHSWTRACAVHELGRRKLAVLRPSLDSALEDPDPIASEAAREAAERWLAST